MPSFPRSSGAAWAPVGPGDITSVFPSFPRGTQGRARKQRPVILRDAKVPSVTETRGRQEGNGTVPGRARVLIERRWTGDVNRYLDTERYSFVSEDFIYLVLASIFLLCILLLMPRRPLQLRPLVTTAPATPLSLARGRGASELFRGPDASIWDRRGPVTWAPCGSSGQKSPHCPSGLPAPGTPPTGLCPRSGGGGSLKA